MSDDGRLSAERVEYPALEGTLAVCLEKVTAERDRLVALVAEIDAACDKVGLPHDLATLIRHYQSSGAAIMGAMGGIVKDQQAELDRLSEQLRATTEDFCAQQTELDRLAALVRQLVDAAVETIRREKHRREDTCQLCGEPYYSARCTSSHAPTYPLATALAAAREQGFVPSGEGVPGIAEAAVADAREMYERTAPRIAPRPVD